MHYLPLHFDLSTWNLYIYIMSQFAIHHNHHHVYTYHIQYVPSLCQKPHAIYKPWLPYEVKHNSMPCPAPGQHQPLQLLFQLFSCYMSFLQILAVWTNRVFDRASSSYLGTGLFWFKLVHNKVGQWWLVISFNNI